MKEKNIAEELINQSLKVIDCIEGKLDPKEVVIFYGSHAVDTTDLEMRLSNKKPKEKAKGEKKIEKAQNKALGTGSIKNKKV